MENAEYSDIKVKIMMIIKARLHNLNMLISLIGIHRQV